MTPETRAKLSAAMRGKRNAAGPHDLTDEGREAIVNAQKRRWETWREQRAKEAQA